MRTVLIVGEADSRSDLEATMLQRSEVRISVVSPGEAVDVAASSRADLVIVDPHVAGARTEAIVAALHAHAAAGARVLILAPPAERGGLIGPGADGFVSRPLTTARLLDAVRRHLPLTERGEARAPFSAKVDFERAGSRGSGYAHDLTSAGLFLVTREPLAVGEEIEIGFALPPPEPHAIRTRARVVRAGNVGAPVHRAAGFGLAFTHLSGQHRIEIARWLRQLEHV